MRSSSRSARSIKYRKKLDEGQIVDNRTVYELLFESEVGLCERFTGLTPLTLRKEKAREVFILITRYNNYSLYREKNKNKKKIIKKPASDNWF